MMQYPLPSKCNKNYKWYLVPHINFVLSGRMKIVMDDGTEKEMGAGDVAVIPPGHDAWVIGDEPCVALDFSGGNIYGKQS